MSLPTVLISRDAASVTALQTMLGEHGVQLWPVATLQIEYLLSDAHHRVVIERWSQFGGVAVTSQHAVAAFKSWCTAHGQKPPVAWAVVGTATATALQRHFGLAPILQAPQTTAQSLADAIVASPTWRCRHWLVLQGADALADLTQKLQQQQVGFTKLTIYCSKLLPVAIDTLPPQPPLAGILTSPRAATPLLAYMCRQPATTHWMSLGPTTTAFLRQAGLVVTTELASLRPAVVWEALHRLRL